MNKLCLVAVNVRSTHNVGAFFRNCDGFGADLYLLGITPYPLGSKRESRLPHIATKTDKEITKTALGAEKTVKWQHNSDVMAGLIDLKEKGYKLVAVEQASSSKPIQKFKPAGPTALIVGPEVDGLSQEILNFCDQIIEIDMQGKKESFNVAVASGIALYQATLYGYGKMFL